MGLPANHKVPSSRPALGAGSVCCASKCGNARMNHFTCSELRRYPQSTGYSLLGVRATWMQLTRLAPLSCIVCETYHLTLAIRRCICHPGIIGMVVAWHIRNFRWLCFSTNFTFFLLYIFAIYCTVVLQLQVPYIEICSTPLPHTHINMN